MDPETALATKSGLAFDIGLTAKNLEPLPILDLGLALEDDALELGLGLFVLDAPELASVDELEQIAAEGHFDDRAELAGLEIANGVGHPTR